MASTRPRAAPPPEAPALRPPSAGRARALLFAAGVLFGLSAVFVRLCTRAGMTGAQVTLLRFGLGLALVCGLFVARPGTFRPVRYGLLASRGFLGGLAALLYFQAIERIPAGEATLLNNTFPIWAVVISFFLLGERPTGHLAVALAIASAGVFLVLGGGQLTFRLGAGELLGIASGVIGGGAVTSIRALRATDNAPTIFFAMTLGGLLVSVPTGLGPYPGSAVAWLAAGGVGVAAFLAQLCMTEAYGTLPIAEAALWQQLTPIATYLWAAAALGEQIGGLTVVGVLLGAAGIAYGSLLGHRPGEPRSREARIAEGIPAEEP